MVFKDDVTEYTVTVEVANHRRQAVRVEVADQVSWPWGIVALVRPPDEADLTPEQKELVALMSRARDRDRDGDLAGARRCYETVRARAPRLPEPIIMLGILSHKEHDLSAAIQYFTDALAVVSESRTRVLRLRAKSLVALGRPDDALKDVDRALSEDPGDPGSRLLRARVLMVLGRDGEARPIVEALLAQQEHPEALWLRAELDDRAGDAAGGARDRARAEEIVARPGGILERFWKPRP